MKDSPVLKGTALAIAIVLMKFAVAASAGANTPPATGTVTNLDEQSTIGYNCRPTSDASIECKFHSVDLSPGLTKEEAEEMRVPGLEEIQAEATPDKCNEMLNGDIRRKLEVKVGEDSLVYKTMTGLLDQYQSLCDSRTEKAARAYVEYAIGMHTRTCKVRVDSWEATFERATEAPGLWVNQSGPDGPCGVINTQSFVHTTIGSLEFFEYVRTRSILKKSGAELCKILPDWRLAYDPVTPRISLHCEFYDTAWVKPLMWD